MKKNNLINRLRYKHFCKKYFKSLDEVCLHNRYFIIIGIRRGKYQSLEPKWKIDIASQCLINELNKRAKLRCSKKRV